MAEIKLISIADDQLTQEQGLMYVKRLPADSGMLFSWKNPRVLSFWMKDTYLPLDIAFIDRDNKIVKIQGMVPLSLRSVTSGSPCVMALEVPMGTFKRLGIETGQTIQVDRDANKVIVSKD